MTYFKWNLNFPSLIFHTETVWSRLELISDCESGTTSCNNSPSCAFQEANNLPPDRKSNKLKFPVECPIPSVLPFDDIAKERIILPGPVET